MPFSEGTKVTGITEVVTTAGGSRTLGTNDRVYAQQRRVHVGDGKRSSIAFHGGHGDHARPISGLGRGTQSLQPHLAKGADDATASRPVSAARAAAVGVRARLRPRLPHAQSDRD